MYLTTDRLVLRDFRITDVDAVHRYGADPEVTKYTLWGPNTWEETVAFVDRAVTSGGPDNLAVCMRGSEEVIGGVGAFPVVNGPADPGALELGWVLRRDMWGQAIIPEAIHWLIREVFISPEVTKVVAFCHPDNERSQRVMQKVGMTFERRFDVEPGVVPAQVFGRGGIPYQEAEATVEEVNPNTAIMFSLRKPGTTTSFTPA